LLLGHTSSALHRTRLQQHRPPRQAEAVLRSGRSPNPARAGAAGKPGAGHPRAGAGVSALVASIPATVREIQALLPDTRKEGYVGRLPGGLQ
jgi:hypothetical protein